MNRTRSREELAWAGGFFSGEGHFCQKVGWEHPNGRRYGHAEAGCTNTELDLLERFALAMGFGTIGLTRKAGKTDSRGVTSTKDCFKWTAKSFESFQATGAMLWPFLGREKREKFKVVLAEAQKRKVWMGHRTRCVHGHPFDEENTLWITKANGRRARQCRTCNRKRRREWEARKKAASA